MKSELLERLSKFLNSISEDALNEQWREIEKLQIEGPSAHEYIEFINKFYCSSVQMKRTKTEIEFPKNMTPNFTGSFFLRKLAA